MDKMIEIYDHPRKKPKDKRGRWFIMGVIAIGVKIWTASYPYLIEKYYSEGLFVVVRKIQDFLFSWLPFPALYLVIPIMLYQIWKAFLAFPKRGCLTASLYTLIPAALWLIFWFTFLWGLNYNRIPTYLRLDMSPSTYQAEEIKQEMDGMLENMLALRSDFCPTDTPVSPVLSMQEMEDKIRPLVQKTMTQLGYHTIKGNPRVRALGFNGLLLRFGTAGFYFPFTGECHIDDALHPLQKPFVIAHELAHGYGEGSEASCNFIAYLACSASDDAFIQYSGKMSFWRYMASSYKSNHPQKYTAYRAALPAEIVRDLNDINSNNAKYPDLIPAYRDYMYDTYLKAQGEKDGNLSYGKMVEMVLGFKQQYPNHPAWQ